MSAYANQLVQLQPPGLALPTEPDSAWVELLEGIAAEFARIDARTADLEREVTLQRGSVELLSEWSEVVSDPQAAEPAGGTPAERLARIRAKLAGVGGQSISYFMDILRQFNAPSHIQECQPFEMGRSGMGDPIGGEKWLYTWRIILEEYVAPETVQAITEIVNRHKPAHTIVTVRIEIPPATPEQRWHQLAGLTAQ